jgi:hypothetical protein
VLEAPREGHAKTLQTPVVIRGETFGLFESRYGVLNMNEVSGVLEAARER